MLITGDPIFVSGCHGSARSDALRQMVTALCEPVGGRHRSVIDELRAELPADRQQIPFRRAVGPGSPGGQRGSQQPDAIPSPSRRA